MNARTQTPSRPMARLPEDEPDWRGLGFDDITTFTDLGCVPPEADLDDGMTADDAASAAADVFDRPLGRHSDG